MGNAQEDFSNLLSEIRRARISLTCLGVGSPYQNAESTRKMFDTVFGPKNYGMVNTVEDAAKAIPEAAAILARAYLERRK